jgi:hypothetical protein
MAHKLRNGLSEDPSRPLHGFLEADETFISGRGDPTSPGRSTANPDKSLVVAAVEKVPAAPKNRSGKHGHVVKRQHGFFAGDARIRRVGRPRPAPNWAPSLKPTSPPIRICRPMSLPARGRDADLDEYLKHTPVIQDGSANAGKFFPIIHTLFSSIKAWLVGTHHGGSAIQWSQLVALSRCPLMPSSGNGCWRFLGLGPNPRAVSNPSPSSTRGATKSAVPHELIGTLFRQHRTS